jgi:hypothetical protein
VVSVDIKRNTITGKPFSIKMEKKQMNKYPLKGYTSKYMTKSKISNSGISIMSYRSYGGPDKI